MENQVIKVLNPEHGKKVIEYWKNKGANIRAHRGQLSSYHPNGCVYYGVIDGKFDNYNPTTVAIRNAEIITLPEFPCMMWVWDDNRVNITKAEVHGIINTLEYPVITTGTDDRILGYKHCKEIEPEISITIKVNGKEVKLSDISEETLLKIRENEKD
ncbi:hypothetical protein [uncultured Mediterranean phage]|nr:hypothetical protein [uncultured Mediterranean phage]